MLEEIKNKLPDEIRQKLDLPISKATHFSDEWNDWAMDLIYKLDLLRDEGLITNDELKLLNEQYFHKLGVIGELSPKAAADYLKFYFLY